MKLTKKLKIDYIYIDFKQNLLEKHHIIVTLIQISKYKTSKIDNFKNI